MTVRQTKTYKCAECGAVITNGLQYPYQGKTYCFECYHKIAEKLQAEEEAKQGLYQYIRFLFSLPGSELPVEVQTSIDRELRNGRTLTGLRLTLKYYYEIQERLRDNPDQAAFVMRDYYDVARRYYANVKALSKLNAAVELTNQTRTVALKKSDLKKKKRGKKPKYEISDL